MNKLFWITLAFLAAADSRAQEKPVSLKDAPGSEVVRSNCVTCHSLDYPRTNAPFMDRKAWENEVNKMISAYGAPITPENAKVIVDYLAMNYGGNRD